MAICLDGFHEAVAGVKLASVGDMESGTLDESNAVSLCLFYVYLFPQAE